MRFQGYRTGAVPGMKVEWDIDVELTDEIRQALDPQDVDTLRVGQLKRAVDVKGHAGGRGKQKATPTVIHRKGALVFAMPSEDYFFIELDDDE